MSLNLKRIPAYANISEPIATNIQPLTTIFTQPESCRSDLYVFDGIWTMSVPWRATDCHVSSPAAFSPGICYSGYEPAATQTNIWSGKTESIVFCCPNEMTVDGTFGCFSKINGIVTLTSPIFMISPPALQTTVYKSWKFMSQVNASNVVSGSSTGTAEADRLYTMTSGTYSTMQSGYLWAPWVQVRFQSTDSDVARSWASIMAGYETNDGRATSMPHSEPADTSSAMVAAIVLGALLILAIVCGAVLVLLRRRQRRRKEEGLAFTSGSEEVQEDALGKQGVMPAEADAEREALEMVHTDPVAEADGHREAGELQCSTPLELPAQVSFNNCVPYQT